MVEEIEGVALATGIDFNKIFAINVIVYE